MTSLTDWLASPDVTHYLLARTGIWVKLTNQSTLVDYISTVTDLDGKWTINPAPPAGNYDVSVGTSSTGPWTATGYTYQVAASVSTSGLALDSAVVHNTGNETIAGNKTETGDWYFKSGRPWVDVIAYGADRTGVADSSTAINNAILACAAAGGGTVFLPAGTYAITAAILDGYPSTVSNIRLTGAGVGATTIRVANAANIATQAIYLGGTDLSIEDLTLDGNKANQTGGSAAGIVSTSGTRITVRNVRVVNSYLRGIYLYQCTDSVITGCSVDNAGVSPTIDSTHAGIVAYQCTGFRIVGNRVASANDHGIWMGDAGSQKGVIADNYVLNPNYIGIALGTNPAQMVVQGNYVSLSNTVTNCIDIGNGTAITVAGNVCVGGGGGIGNAPPSFQTAITGNTIINPAIDGIYYGGAAGPAQIDSTITGNVIKGAGDYGIGVPSAVGLVVANNIIMNNGGAVGAVQRCGIYLYGDGTAGYINGLTIIGNRIGNDAGGTAQQYAFKSIGGANQTNIVIADNDLRNNAAGIFTGTSATTGCIIRGNLGHNPVGSFTAPTVPASTVACTAQPYDATVFVTAGTSPITAIKLGATTLTYAVAAASTTSAGIRVPAGQTLAITYAGGTPTWVWIGD